LIDTGRTDDLADRVRHPLCNVEAGRVAHADDRVVAIQDFIVLHAIFDPNGDDLFADLVRDIGLGGVVPRLGVGDVDLPGTIE
jgi:hypothetical protein